MEDWRYGGFGLYVHWPFCQTKCPYCDFNSHVVARVDTDRWRRAYLAEIDRIGAGTGDRVLNSIFFGGGTPSLMPPDLVGEIIAQACHTWIPANDLEVTLEANPSSVEAGRFRAFQDGGVNRVSLGVQALNDRDLRRLGRLHSVSEALKALEIARASFSRISFDLIYARQDQTRAAWRAELRDALALAGDHLSLYQLTIEEGTAFGDRHARGGLRGLPDEDLAADLYEITQEMTDAAGFSGYEVSNHARNGAESRHNLIYWRCGDYAGIGPGAHGRLTVEGVRWATEARMSPGVWLGSVESRGTGEQRRERVPAGAQAGELLMMGLRLQEGVGVERYRALAGTDPVGVSALVADGLLDSRDGRLRATPRGRMVLNRVVAALLPG